MPRIEKIHAREVLDSRGNPTVEVEVFVQGGYFGHAIVPSGASTGRHEAHELRDGDPKRFEGKGVLKAIANVHAILAPALVGLEVREQEHIDQTMIELDGTANKSRLGANAILGVSLACAHAAAHAEGLPLYRYLDRFGRSSLPLPMVNIISGGMHAGGQLAFQDFMLMPIGAATYSDALQMIVVVYKSVGRRLMRDGYEGVLVGDEGGYGPRLPSNRTAMDILIGAIEDAGLKPGVDAGIAIDVASTHFHRNGQYDLEGRMRTADEMIGLLEEWSVPYPLLSIEDGMAEDDWEGWRMLTERLGSQVQLVGDDLFVTNPRRLAEGIRRQVANAILIKPNQIGTLTETLQVIDQAKKAGYRTIVSARSGETEDTTLADLAVGTGAGQIKIGSVARSERLAKYNRLLRIEEELGPHARYAGHGLLARRS